MNLKLLDVCVIGILTFIFSRMIPGGSDLDFFVRMLALIPLLLGCLVTLIPENEKLKNFRNTAFSIIAVMTTAGMFCLSQRVFWAGSAWYTCGRDGSPNYSSLLQERIRNYNPEWFYSNRLSGNQSFHLVYPLTCVA